jgi:hypothetical protein
MIEDLVEVFVWFRRIGIWLGWFKQPDLPEQPLGKPPHDPPVPTLVIDRSPPPPRREPFSPLR